MFDVVWDYYSLKLQGKQYTCTEHLTKKLHNWSQIFR